MAKGTFVCIGHLQNNQAISQRGIIKISSKDKLRFYNISQGSLEETRNFIILSKDLGYITLQDKEQLGIQAAEISRLLNAYCIALLKNVSPPTT